ncbi:SusC/RagA family TonB-linked outer membrane protein [Lewinella sp. IMCC34183]|uniref:SusC/RagA family TonB-linked outer membrane protein n=1 Tax=Lewinella sp. IMCC34183 TaxID=2248762 RepID=UPI0018E52935|nr:TonB-dependent receptor [Lewinella sp. IMCC34183]
MKLPVRACLLWLPLLLFSLTAAAQSKTVTGTVADNTGVTLPGASVLVKGTSRGTQTDFDGNFSLNVDTGAVLVFSYAGYAPSEVTVDSRSTYDVVLETDAAILDEVVVVGYQTQRKSDVTGSVTSVQAEELMTQPVNNAFEALQGKAAGVDITSNQRPGEVGSIRIRGNRSLTASNSPLFVVDGIPLLSESAIETLNPRDIESISVLKDASATAIYGSRGANGVVIVTTKQGQSGRFQLSYYGTLTTSEIVDRAPSMSAEEFIRFRRWAAYNLDPDTYAHPDDPTRENDAIIFDSALDGQATRDNVLRGWESGTFNPNLVQNTDWTDLVTRTGVATEHTLAASGGTDKMRAYGSFGYLSNKGTQRGQFYERYTTKLSADITPIPWFSMDGTLNVSYSEQDYGFSTLGGRSNSVPNAIYGAASSIYNMAVPYDEAGNPIINPGGESTIYTIVDEWNRSTQLSETLRALASLSATFDFGEMFAPLEGLRYQFRFGPDFRYGREGVYIDGTSAHKINSDGSEGASFARLNNRRDFSWTLDNMIFYNKTLGGLHDVGLTLLQTASKWNIENMSLSGNNIPLASMRWNAFGVLDITDPQNSIGLGSGLNERQLNSYMVRMNYGFDNRYLLTVSGRWDGASQLGEGNKWDFFPSVALAWKIKNEDFLTDSDQVTELKLRVGFGQTGNSAVSPYATIGDIRSIFLPFNGIGNQIGYTTNEPYYSRNQLSLANPNLGWEKTSQYNVGLDFGLIRNRIFGSLDAYVSSTEDLLLSVNIPTLTGFPSTIANIGRTSNRGVELSITGVPIQSGTSFFWETNFNGAWQKDRIEELAYGRNDMVDNGWFIGEPIGVIYGFDNLGLWQDTPEDLAEIDRWNENGYDFSPGNVRPRDLNGDYEMTIADRILLGNTAPRWTLGWTNTFGYKGIELGIFLYSRLGYNSNLGGQALTAHSNQRELDYWTPDNPGAEFQKPILGQATSGSQDDFSGLLGINRAGFVKIRYINLGYNVPTELGARYGIDNLKIYIQALNPGSIYQANDWYDFDVNSTIFNRSFVVGLNVGI